MFECKTCFKSRNDESVSTCEYSAANNIDPMLHLTYNKLPDLNDIEQIFISLVNAVMKVYHLSKSNIRCKENVFNMQQDIQEVIRKLPRLP